MCVFEKIKFRDNYKPAHCIGRLKLISQDIDNFFKRATKFAEKKAIVTGNIEEEENAAVNTNNDADENAEAN